MVHAQTANMKFEKLEKFSEIQKWLLSEFYTCLVASEISVNMSLPEARYEVPHRVSKFYDLQGVIRNHRNETL